MLAKFEKRAYEGSERVWVGKYKNLHNISHWHMENEIIYCQKGNALVSINDRSYCLKDGECVFLSSGTVHYIDADESSVLLVCLFDNKLSTFAGAMVPENPIITDAAIVGERLGDVRRELKERRAYFEKKTEAIVIEIVADLFRSVPLVSVPGLDVTMNRYKQLLHKIDNEYEFISFEDAARYMNFSPAYFSKYFKRQAGLTFSQYLNVVRIEKAVEMINIDRSMKIADVSMRCGFSTLRSFNREFARIVGFPPRNLPQGYVLNTRSIPGDSGAFDPTMKPTILVKE